MQTSQDPKATGKEKMKVEYILVDTYVRLFSIIVLLFFFFGGALFFSSKFGTLQ